MKAKLYHSRVVFILAASLILFLAFLYKDEVNSLISILLISPKTSAIFWIAVIVSVCVDQYYDSLIVAGGDSPTYSFSLFSDAVTDIGTLGFCGTTSISLLSGLHSQYFYDKQEFLHFGNFDLISIFIVSAFLLFYSLQKVIKLIKGVIYQVNAEVAEPNIKM